MTKEEAAALIRMNYTLYKLGAKPLTDEEMETIIDIWTYQFKDYPGDMVKRAFLAANRVCVYPITVADIFQQLSRSIDPSAAGFSVLAFLPDDRRRGRHGKDSPQRRPEGTAGTIRPAASVGKSLCRQRERAGGPGPDTRPYIPAGRVS